MELTNEFQVAVPVDTAWALLTDVERIAPCLPGATLEEVAGEEYRGVVKVKVGPITTSYRGSARFVARDDARHEAVLRAQGRETRGQGNATATVTFTLTAEGEGTAGRVVTDVNVSGRVAQLGRGVLSDVSAKLIAEFVACLERDLMPAPPSPTVVSDLPAEAPVAPRGEPSAVTAVGPADDADPPSPSAAPPGTPERPVRPVRPAPPEAGEKVLDLLDLAGPSLARRLAPAAVAGLAAALLFARRRRRRGA